MSRHHIAAGWGGKSATARARIRAAGQVQACIRCGRMIDLDAEPWDAGHRVPLAQGGNVRDYGPEHRGENRRAGGRAGRAVQMRATRSERRMLPW